ncbi:nuclear transport factor 2 family protein [Novosphingobium malaysiense]|uniref:SnoaL-like domain-containing protein n=1 Tax=Novosphingobium malaysiense TaxID=1348853 RepID=A0A0B1ZM57_9SPHN|nr:nuclear transport factor 2 family protein [Novosphingobium malaysiense]KHK90283.1 hypothetical protein LK12_16795 [Novosphingobium malaysiense]
MTRTIDDLLAEAEIRDLHIRYCRGADRMDFDLMRSSFHPDAVVDYGQFGTTVDDLIAGAEEGLKTFLVTTHSTANQLVEINGDCAWAEHYTLATHRLSETDEATLRDYVVSLRYIDRLERRAGTWKIAMRKLVVDWMRTDPVDAGQAAPKGELGRRDRSDPSYLRNV